MKSKITFGRTKMTSRGKDVYPKGPYANKADAVMGRTRGNLGRVVMPKPKPKVSPIKFKETAPNPNYKPSTGWRVGP